MSRGSSTTKSLLCSSCKLGLRKCSLSYYLYTFLLSCLRYSYGELTSIFKLHFWIQRLSTCCSSLNAVQSRKLSSLNQSNESALSNEDFKLMDIDIAGRVHLAYDIRLDLQFACLFPQGGCVHNES